MRRVFSHFFVCAVHLSKVKRFNTEGTANCGEKSEKDKGVYCSDAEFAEKGNGKKTGETPALLLQRIEEQKIRRGPQRRGDGVLRARGKDNFEDFALGGEIVEELAAQRGNVRLNGG
jgi:hypothetical protein